MCWAHFWWTSWFPPWEPKLVPKTGTAKTPTHKNVRWSHPCFPKREPVLVPKLGTKNCRKSDPKGSLFIGTSAMELVFDFGHSRGLVGPRPHLGKFGLVLHPLPPHGQSWRWCYLIHDGSKKHRPRLLPPRSRRRKQNRNRGSHSAKLRLKVRSKARPPSIPQLYSSSMW